MFNVEMIPLLIMALAGVSAASIVWVVAHPYISEDWFEKRRTSVTESMQRKKQRIANIEQANHRRQAVADTLKELERRQATKQKLTLRIRLQRAGLDVSANTFWLASVGTGIVCAFLAFLAMPSMNPMVFVVVGFIGAFGLPRWFVGFLTRRRQAKFLNEFANSLDVIIRGVKSGLPLGECLGIIARESPEPIRSEFVDVVEQMRVGVPLSECFERMINRMPLAEVRFFAIVIGIQQKAGGNLSEALGNLAGVLRDRKSLANKVKALSAEAKASAMVLAALPFIVAGLVYITTPGYISLMWTTRYGSFMLLIAGVWMTIGVLVMKKMVEFKY